MFGILRTTLALMVVVYHLFISVAPLGMYPVFGFYVISGYLMTLIMHQTYGFTAEGQRKFLTNRFLRLYPTYWAVALLSVVIICVVGETPMASFHAALFLPKSGAQIASNVSLMFPAWIPWTVLPRLSPPTWTLTVEIFFYLLISFGISRTPTRTVIWLVVSVLYVIASFATGQSESERYAPIPAASLPFSIGSSIFFLSQKKQKLNCYINGISTPVIYVMFLANCATWCIVNYFDHFTTHHRAVTEAGAYINIILCGLLVLKIASGGSILTIPKHIDKVIGDFSYPVYLLHWPLAAIVSYCMFGEPLRGRSARGILSLAFTMGTVFACSILLKKLVEEPIEHIRSRIKNRTEALPESQTTQINM